MLPCGTEWLDCHTYQQSPAEHVCRLPVEYHDHDRGHDGGHREDPEGHAQGGSARFLEPFDPGDGVRGGHWAILKRLAARQGSRVEARVSRPVGVPVIVLVAARPAPVGADPLAERLAQRLHAGLERV
jgi:hypothetical protein